MSLVNHALAAVRYAMGAANDSAKPLGTYQWCRTMLEARLVVRSWPESGRYRVVVMSPPTVSRGWQLHSMLAPIFPTYEAACVARLMLLSVGP